MKLNYLTRHVLPQLKSTDLAIEGNDSLTAVGHILLSLYELAAFSDISLPDYGREACVRHITELARLLGTRIARESDPRQRAGLLHTRYALLRGTVTPFNHPDEEQEEACHREVRRLMADHHGPQSAATETALCHCIVDMLYPVPECDTEARDDLDRRLQAWASALDADGHWPGLDRLTALERIEVLHRYGFMLLDDRHEALVRRLCTAYAVLPDDTDDGLCPSSVADAPTCAARCQLSVALYRLRFSLTYRPDRRTARTLAAAADDPTLPRPIRLQALAVAAHAAAEQLVEEVQESLAV